MVSLPELNAAPGEEFVIKLGGIYEHSDWVPRRIIDKRPFLKTADLQLAMRMAVDGATAEEKLQLIRAHPDLAGKLARSGALTKASTSEQARLGLDRLSDGEYEEFSDRNQRYREKFDFPFVICARLTTKRGILEAFEKRLGNPVEAEISEALMQIHHIAKLRLGDLIVTE